jgi:hypothetical protein
MIPAELPNGYSKPDTNCQMELLVLLEELREKQHAAKRRGGDSMTAIDMPRTVTGAALREMRDAAGLSLQVMAERAWCSRQHLARVESGERALTRDIGRGISRAIAARTIEMRAAKRDPPHNTAGVRPLADGVDTAPPDLFASEQHFHTLTLATAPSEVKLTDATPELTD